MQIITQPFTANHKYNSGVLLTTEEYNDLCTKARSFKDTIKDLEEYVMKEYTTKREKESCLYRMIKYYKSLL